MDIDTLKEVIKQLEAEGHSKEDIMKSFIAMYINDKLNLEQLDAIVNVMGYHLSDKFKKASKDKQIKMIKKGKL